LRCNGIDLLGQIELSGRVCDLGAEIAQEIIATVPCGLPDSSPSNPCLVCAKEQYSVVSLPQLST